MRRLQAVGQPLLLLILALATASCWQYDNEMLKEAATRSRITANPLLVGPLYKFATDLFHTVRDPEKNVIFSPFSMQVALNMLALGVEKGSQTERDILQTLGYGGNTTLTGAIHEANSQLRPVFNHEAGRASGGGNGAPKLGMINFAIVNKFPIEPEYLNATKKHYGAAVRQILNQTDEQRALDEINSWGKEAGFSNNILPRGDLKGTVLVLLNACRVEAYWFDAFYEIVVPNTGSPLYKHGVHEEGSSTKTGQRALAVSETMVRFVEFTKNKRSKHRARNELARAKQADHYDELAGFEFRAVSIPLRGDISYTIIEPLAANGTTKELGRLEDALFKQSGPAGASRLAKIMALVDGADQVAANIRMPGFKYEQDIDLKQSLRSMGLGRIFDAETADLSSMSPGKNLYVDSVKHQAMIDVNEKGIKAAATTRIMILLSALMHREVIEVNVENPFIHVIRLNKLPLFVGHLVKV